MLVREAVEELLKLPQDKELHCQVVGTENGAWNMEFKFSDTKIPRIAVITVSHRQLTELPDWPKPI